MPGKITQQLGPLTYVVGVADGQTWKRHADHLRNLSCDNPSSVVDLRTNDSTSSEENSEFMPTVTSPSPTSSESSSACSNVVPVRNQEPDTAAASDSVSTSRYPTRVRRPPDRLTH